jgi:hypothetical protein
MPDEGQPIRVGLWEVSAGLARRRRHQPGAMTGVGPKPDRQVSDENREKLTYRFKARYVLEMTTAQTLTR